MACSTAQLESNRKNAKRSTGPRTAEGKARSRANGLKHGLTGAGIVLPNEDAEVLEERFATLKAEMAPRTELGRQLVLRVALFTVRLDRSALHEARATAHRMRRAAADFDDARLTEVEEAFQALVLQPATHARRLRNTPEGIDRLLWAMQGLRDDLTHPHGMRWGMLHCERFHHLMGQNLFDLPVSRARALSDAIAGDFKHLTPDDRPELAAADRKLWALCELVDLIDGELAQLKALRARFDQKEIDLDRAEAADRAMFDGSKDAVLARKYEAATERGFYRALREFQEIQANSPEAEQPPEVEEELGSSLPESSETKSETTELDAIVTKCVPEAIVGEALVSRDDMDSGSIGSEWDGS